MPEYNDGFDEAIKGYSDFPTAPVDQTPYGNPAQPVKTGLTPRGKAALGLSAAVLISGGFLIQQHYSAETAANEARAAELTLQQQQIELDKLKEINKANAADQETRSEKEKERREQVDACVNENKAAIGKAFGVTYGRVVEDCQAQYGAPAQDVAMKSAATASDTPDGGGDVTSSLVIGGTVLVGGLVLAATRNNTKRHQPALPTTYLVAGDPRYSGGK